jgi:radical SAM protein with 4Fe4S-binding SPASM domain
LTGGEPLLRKDVKEILSIFKGRNLAIDITSSLTLLDASLLDDLLGLNIRSVGCSIYSAQKELHDGVTRVRGSFDKSIAAIRSLRSAGIPVLIKSPLMTETAPYWRELKELAAQLGCELQFDLFITAKTDGNRGPIARRVSDPRLLKEIMSSGLYVKFPETSPKDSRPGDRLLCGAGSCGLAVAPNGDIRPCLAISEILGKYPADRLDSVWNCSPFFEEWGKKTMGDIEKCSKCSVIMYCNKCAGAWKAENGSYYLPSDYSCFLAKIFSETVKDGLPV